MKRLIIFITTIVCLLIPSVAFAYNPLDTACHPVTGGTVNSSACSVSSNDPITGPQGVLRKVTLMLAVIASVAAVIIIIVSGFRYIAANGDPQKAASARSGIVGALIGLVIIAASTTIVVFVVSKL